MPINYIFSLLLLIINCCFFQYCLASREEVEENYMLNNKENPSLSAEFPNFFFYLDNKEAKTLLEESVQSILNRSEIPHLWEGEINTDDFFKKLHQISKRTDSERDIYISGGVIRSVLGYIYQKLYKTHIKTQRLFTSDTIREALKKNIINSEKKLSLLKVFGIGSDLDILVSSVKTKAEKKETNLIEELKNFINSAEDFFNLREVSFDLKKSAVPIADVKNYDEQLGLDISSHNSVYQGGSSLDWLSFSINKSGKFHFPKNNLKILDQFIQGYYSYRPHPLEVPFSDKQVMRGLRPLLEIPFLRLEEESKHIVIKELSQIEDLSESAKYQLSKMMRNARLEAAHNRFTRHSSFKEETLLIEAIRRILKTELKEILPYRPLLSSDKGFLKHKGYLEDPSSFFNKFLYHGTPNIDHAIFMMRGGFFVSHETQGAAAYGRGFYTFDNADNTECYKKNSGITLNLKIRENNNLRVVDLMSSRGNDLKNYIFEKHKLQEDGDINKIIVGILSKEYEIDLIKVTDSIILLQNTAAIKFKKDLNLLFEMIYLNNVDQFRKVIDKPDLTVVDIGKFYKYRDEIDKFKSFQKFVEYNNKSILDKTHKTISDFIESVKRQAILINPDIDMERIYYLINSIKYLIGKKKEFQIFDPIYFIRESFLEDLIHSISVFDKEKLPKNYYCFVYLIKDKTNISQDEMISVAKFFNTMNEETVPSVFSVLSMLIEQEYYEEDLTSYLTWPFLLELGDRLTHIDKSKLELICDSVTWLISKDFINHKNIQEIIDVLDKYNVQKINFITDTLKNIKDKSFSIKNVKEWVFFLGDDNLNVEKFKNTFQIICKKNEGKQYIEDFLKTIKIFVKEDFSDFKTSEIDNLYNSFIWLNNQNNIDDSTLDNILNLFMTHNFSRIDFIIKTLKNLEDKNFSIKDVKEWVFFLGDDNLNIEKFKNILRMIFKFSEKDSRNDILRVIKVFIEENFSTHEPLELKHLYDSIIWVNNQSLVDDVILQKMVDVFKNDGFDRLNFIKSSIKSIQEKGYDISDLREWIYYLNSERLNTERVKNVLSMIPPRPKIKTYSGNIFQMVKFFISNEKILEKDIILKISSNFEHDDFLESIEKAMKMLKDCDLASISN